MPSRSLPYSTSSAAAAATFTIIAVIVTLIIIIIIIFYYYFIYRRRRSRTIPLIIHSTNLHRFVYNHLLAATNSFSTDNIIGKGASATVYRGVLPNGKSVAVKLINLTSGHPSSTAQIEFENELRILSRLNSPFVVPLLGYSIKNNHRVLVYEYMPNRSLQETLFQEKSDNLTWDQRFVIVQDVARALAYLHLECDPPIIHGDVKPSNVLLDMDFRARVSDFGLSRVKEDEEVEEEFGPPFSQELSGNMAAAAAAEIVEAGSSRHYGYNEVDFARALQASASPNTECILSDHLVMVEDSVIGKNDNGEVGKTIDQGICSEDVVSRARHCVEGDLEEGSTQWGRDWWWRQDGSSKELCSKDYVTEWIGSQICPASNDENIHGWDDGGGEKSAGHHSSSPVCIDSLQLQMGELKLGTNEGRNPMSRRDKNKKMHRKLHEWWGEEHPVKISKTRIQLRKLEKKLSKSFKKPILTLSKSVKLKRKRKFVEHDGDIKYIDSHLDFNFMKSSKKNKEAHPEGSELWSGDLFSRELSSTTSMRGTLCYIAPECGGGYLIEKADIYSFGVLILVIVSGRRPLHVLSSPMKLEKANLVSWCRQLAQSGNVLELVDKRLMTQGYNEVQAALCINLALSCLQKMPELRPDIGDVVKVLDGEMDLPDLPFELSPSPPPPKLLSRSRSRHKAKVDKDIPWPLPPEVSNARRLVVADSNHTSQVAEARDLSSQENQHSRRINRARGLRVEYVARTLRELCAHGRDDPLCHGLIN